MLRERGRQWARDNMAQQVEYQRQYTAELKTQVLAHYGEVCKCCGCRDFDYLTVDHIDGNGGEHRVELFGSNKAAGRVFYLWLIRNGFPDGYQSLCKSCNYSKGKTPQCRKDHSRGRVVNLLGRTHPISGVVTGVAVGSLILHERTAPLGLFTALTVAYSLASDLDSCGSTEARSLGFVTAVLSRFVRAISGGHRHGTHSAF